MTERKKDGPKLGSGRHLSKRVKTAKGRPIGSTMWLRRQLNDPYVAEAQKRGYRSRAAFKLSEIDDKLHILKRGARVVDLGAAPGGWTQVAVERTKAGDPGGGTVVGLDLLEMGGIPGATLLQADFLDDAAPALVKQAMGGDTADLVLSDMAPSATGDRGTDHLRIMHLAEIAFAFAEEVLAPGGTFIAKLRQGGGETEFVNAMRPRFAKVQRIKPPASRPESAEFFVVATGFKRGG